MSLLVVYQSETGFTEQYAKWIAEELDCEFMSIKKVKSLESYDTVIFGGWVFGNMIMGLDNINKLAPKKLIAFACGASKESEEVIKNIKEVSHIGDIPFFYMEGGFHYDKIGFMKKMMLKMVKKSIAKKENKTQQDIDMEKMLGSSVDNSSKDNISELVSYVKECS